MKIFHEPEGNQLLNLETPKEFPTPYTIVDIFQDREIKPDIRVFEDLEILKEVSFILYAIPIDRDEAWAPRQRDTYFLREKGSPIDEDSRVLTKIPKNHFIEIDVANRKVRISGRFIEKNKSCSEWNYY